MASLSDAVARPRVYINTDEIPSDDGNNVIFNRPLPLADAIEKQPEATVAPKVQSQPTVSTDQSSSDPEPSKVQAILDKLFGLHGQERYQLWPEKLARDALSAPHDVMTGQIPQYEVDPVTGEAHTSTAMIKAAQDVSALAGTGGLAGTGKEAGVSLGVVPVDVAKKLNFKTGTVSDDLKAAVQNTAGASIDADGHLIVKVARAQHPDQEMAESVRGGVFYQPSGNKSFSYTGKNNYGGSQKVDGETAYLNPLVVKGATGGKAPETAYNQLIGDKKAYANMRADAMKTLGTYGKRPDAADVWKFLDKYAPELSDYAQYIIDNSKSGNQLPYALQEAAVASAARKAGHDGIVGYSVGRDGTKRLSEIFDVRENRYPSPDGDYSIHPELLADSSKESAALQANKPFYSAVENALTAAKQPKADAQQWLSFLKNQPGVKQEELAHLGLDKLSGAITKDDLLKAVQEGQPQIKEVVKGIPVEQRNALIDARNRGEITTEELAAKVADLEKLGPVKFPSYQLPGATNYREMLLTLPDKQKRLYEWEYFDPKTQTSKQFKTEAEAKAAAPEGSIVNQKEVAELNPAYKSSHWDEPNVLAHIRMNDRYFDNPDVIAPKKLTDADFARMKELDKLLKNPDYNDPKTIQLMKEQNELGARMENGKDDTFSPNRNKLKSLHLEEIQSDWHQAGRKQGYNDLNSNELKRYDDLIKASNAKNLTDEEFSELENLANRKKGVPDAPFKKTWDELALKKALTEAIKNGYDSISWTPGEAQAARYDLSKQVDKIAIPMVNKDGTRSIRVDAKGGSPFKLMVNKDGIVEGHGGSSSQFTGKPLSDVVGKEMADKIMKLEKPDEFSGDGLKIGGQGMKAFYDKMLVDKMNALTRKYGGKVEKSDLSIDKRKTVNEIANDLGFGNWHSLTEAQRSRVLDVYNIQKPQRQTSEYVHVLKITPELREHVLKKGFPLFASAPIFTPVSHNPFEKDKQ